MVATEVSEEELTEFINIVKELNKESFRLMEHDAKLLRMRDMENDTSPIYIYHNKKP